MGADAPDLAFVAAAAAMERKPTPRARAALLEAARGARDLVMIVPPAPVAQFAADGAYLTHDGRVAVRWDPRHPAHADTLRFAAVPGLDSALAGAFTPDGRTFAAVVRDGPDGSESVLVQDAGGRVATLAHIPPSPSTLVYPPQFDPVLAFSADGRRLAVRLNTNAGAGQAAVFLVWTRPGAAPTRFGRADTVRVAWSPATVPQGVPERPQLQRLAFSPDGRWLAGLGEKGVLVAVGLADPAGTAGGAAASSPVARARVNAGGIIEALAVSDAGVVATAGLGATIDVPGSLGGSPAVVERVVAERWTVARDTVERAWPAGVQRQATGVRSIALTADARALVVGRAPGVLDQGELLADSGAAAARPASTRAVEWLGGSAPSFSPDGQYAASRDGQATRLWRLPAPLAAAVTLPAAAELRDAQLSGDGRWIVATVAARGTPSAPTDCRLIRYDRRTGAADTLLRAVDRSFNVAVLSPDGRWRAEATGTLGAPAFVVRRRRLDAGSGREAPAETLATDGLPRVALALRSPLAIANDGATYFAAVDAGGEQSVWALRRGAPARPLGSVHRGAARVRTADGGTTSGGPLVAVDADRGCLLVLTVDNVLTGWDLAGGGVTLGCTPPSGPTAGAAEYWNAHAAAGRLTLFGNFAGKIAVWDYGAGRPVTVSSGDARDAVLSPAGWLYRLRSLPGPTAALGVDSVPAGNAPLAADACRLAAAGATRARWAAAERDYEPPRCRAGLGALLRRLANR